MAQALYADGTEAKVGDIVIGPGIGQFDRGSRDICIVTRVSEAEGVFNLGVNRIASIIVSNDGNKVVMPRQFDGHDANRSVEWTKIA